MDQYGVVMSHFMLELTDRFQERLAFDITYCAAYFDDGDMCILRGEIAVKPAVI